MAMIERRDRSPDHSSAVPAVAFDITPRTSRSVSVDDAQELLSSAVPVLLVERGGTILACNRLGAWLRGLAPQNLVLSNMYTLSATGMREGLIPYCCNGEFESRKLEMFREIDPAQMLIGHKHLAKAVEEEHVCQHQTSCPIQAEPRFIARKTDWRYRLFMYRSDTWPDTDFDNLLHFVVSDLALGKKRAAVPKAKEHYVVVFDAATEHTSRIIADAYEGIKKTAPAGTYVWPTVELVQKIMYNEILNPLGMIEHESRRMASGNAQWQKDRRNRSVGELLRELRLQSGVSADEIALRVGVSRPSITHWETGRRSLQQPHHIKRLIEILRPSPPERDRLLAYLGLDPVSFEQETGDRGLALLEQRIAQIAELQHQVVDLQTEIARQTDELAVALKRHRIDALPSDVDETKGQTVFDSTSRGTPDDATSPTKDDRAAG